MISLLIDKKGFFKIENLPDLPEVRIPVMDMIPRWGTFLTKEEMKQPVLCTHIIFDRIGYENGIAIFKEQGEDRTQVNSIGELSRYGRW